MFHTKSYSNKITRMQINKGYEYNEHGKPS